LGPEGEVEGEPAAAVEPLAGGEPEPESELAAEADSPTKAASEAEPAPTGEAESEPEPETTPEPAVLAAAVGEATQASAMSTEGASDAPDDTSLVRGYREALLIARAKPVDARTRLLSSPALRLSALLGAALVVIVITAGVLYLYSTRSSNQSTKAISRPATSHAATPTPVSHPTPSVGPTAAASPAVAGVPGPLSQVVIAGSGGTGWTVSHIRLGSPGSGITRVVLDIAGTGSTPSAQLGRGSDGSIYLTVPGLAISPSVVSGLTPTGALTAITQVGGSGTNLKFITNGNPGFSIGYLTGPYRLVLDFK
jgi:hypothetical protein